MIPWTVVGVAVATAALAAVLLAYLGTWPQHEDETLALFVARDSLPGVLHSVIVERGGAPLHFVFAWAVVQLGGGLTALRLVSLVFAVASIPAIAALGARLADRVTGLAAAVLASGTWVVLFHGIYGRMYSLFLFTSVLAVIAMLDALALGGRRRFLCWGICLWLLLAAHPYGVLVLGAQAVYVAIVRTRLRPAVATFLAVAVAAVPFWYADVVLRNRFEVGVGGGGAQLGSPGAVAHYFWWVSGEMAAGHHAWSTPVLLLALAGAIVLARSRPLSLVLTGCMLVVPATAFVLARLHSTASPEARHLIFALPFFSTLLAVPLVRAARLRPPLTTAAALVAITALVAGEVRWAHRKTPPLFDGDRPGESAARDAAATWLAAGRRTDDVLLGYEPVYLRAWEQDRSFSRLALPRADAKLLAQALRDIPEPLGRGVWVFDASDTTNVRERQTIRFALPGPSKAFEGRAFGPYLVIRSREPLRTRTEFVDVSKRVMRLGVRLGIGDADINLRSLLIAQSRFL